MPRIWRHWVLGLMAVLFAVAGELPAIGEPAVISGSVERLVVFFPQVVGAVYVLGLQDSGITVFGAEYHSYPPAIEANEAGRER